MAPNLEELKDYLKLRIEILKLLKSLPRLRLILLLLIFRKLSLTKLSSLVGRTKSAVIQHIKKFNKLGIIKTTLKKTPGLINAKSYELIPGFLKKFIFKIDEILPLKPEERKEIFDDSILNDKLFFELIRNLFNQAIFFYQAIDEKNLDPKLEAFKNFQNIHFKTPIKYNYWILSEEGREAYEKLIEKFNTSMKEIIARDELKGVDLIRPYFIFNSVIPIMELAQYDSDLKVFRQFFKAID